MKHMSLHEITAACKGIYHGDPSKADKEVSNVVIDSRKAGKDSLFVAIRGARVDGHTFIPKVMEAGALCAVSEQDLGDTDYPYIRVESCEQALKDIAEHYRRSLDIKVVGISGSVGKTSTKEMIASVLSRNTTSSRPRAISITRSASRSPSSISVKSTRWPCLRWASATSVK